MNSASQIIYPIIFIIAVYLIFKNFKNEMSYRKENMQPLIYLKEDDKIRQLISKLVISFVIVLTAVIIIGLISSNNFTTESFYSTVLLPLLMILLYIPLIKKTFVSTLGIHKRGALIRWEDIKAVNYYKTNEKNQNKVKVVYTFAGRDANMGLVFKKDDPQYETFKETAKEYRNSKKKEKKSDK